MISKKRVSPAVCDTGSVALTDRSDQVKGMSEKASFLQLIARFNSVRLEAF